MAATVLLTIALAGATPAAAALLDLGGVTRDTDSNLDWLDLASTLGQSFDAVSAGFGGYTAAGWQFADIDQLTTLFTNAGYPAALVNSGNHPEQAAVDAGVLLQGLLGVTDGVPGANSVTRSLGLYIDPSSAFPRIGEVRVQRNVNGTPFTGGVFHGNFTFANSAVPTVGSFLVRAVPTADSVTVPEPEPLLLMGLGALALVSLRLRWRWRRQGG